MAGSAGRHAESRPAGRDRRDGPGPARHRPGAVRHGIPATRRPARRRGGDSAGSGLASRAPRERHGRRSCETTPCKRSGGPSDLGLTAAREGQRSLFPLSRYIVTMMRIPKRGTRPVGRSPKSDRLLAESQIGTELSLFSGVPQGIFPQSAVYHRYATPVGNPACETHILRDIGTHSRAMLLARSLRLGLTSCARGRAAPFSALSRTMSPLCASAETVEMHSLSRLPLVTIAQVDRLLADSRVSTALLEVDQIRADTDAYQLRAAPCRAASP